MAEIQNVRAVFIEPQAEGAEGLWVAEDPTRKDCLQVFAHGLDLGGFGLTREGAKRLHEVLDQWLYRQLRQPRMPVSDRLAWDGEAFVLREDQP